MTVEKLHAFWRDPWAGRNQPDDYLSDGTTERSLFLLGLMERHVPLEASVLEVGCNAGRNLAYLHAAGYDTLAGLDISNRAVALLRTAFPELEHVPVTVGPAEDVLPELPTASYDAVVTMATLAHLHTASAAVFREIARIAGSTLITVEDERHASWRHFPRDYRRVFEDLGLEQVEAQGCADIEGLGPQFVARVFGRPV